MTNLMTSMVKRFVRLMVWLLSTVYVTLHAQHIGYKQYTVADGLVQSEVTAIHQDQKGFIWVGTKMGLSRFDGIDFETIRDSANVLRSVVWHIDQLNDSALIINTARGYALVSYGKSGMRLKTEPLSFPFLSYWIRKEKGEILTLIDGKLKLIAIDHTGPHEQPLPFHGLSKEEIFSRPGFWIFYGAKTDHYFLMDIHGLYATVKNNRRQKINIPDKAITITKGLDGNVYLMSVIVDQPGQKAEVSIVTVKDNAITPFYRSTPRFTNADLAPFIMDSTQFFVFDAFDNSFIRVIKGKTEVYKTDHPIGWTQMVDREGNLWLGGPHGLFRISGFSAVVYTEEDGFLPNSQSIFTDGNDDLVIATFDQGLRVLKDGIFKQIPVPNRIFPENRVNLYPGSRRDSRGIAHIVGPPHTVIRWDGKKSSILKITPLVPLIVFSMIRQNSGSYMAWITD